MDTGFYRKKHNPQFFSGTARGPLSLFSEQSALAASAALSANGILMHQLKGQPPLLYAQVPGVYGAVVPSGGTSATGSSNHWVIVQVGTPSGHVFPYAPEIFSALSASGWIPTGR